jgi:hypothetical protein
MNVNREPVIDFGGKLGYEGSMSEDGAHGRH